MRWRFRLIVATGSLLVLGGILAFVFAERHLRLTIEETERPSKSVPSMIEKILIDPVSVEVFSLDFKNSAGGEFLYGHHVLGKTLVKDSRNSTRIAGFFKQAIERGSYTWACFEPRHALRVIRNGETLDVILCFECRNFHWYVNGESQGELPIHPGLEVTLDYVLRRAGVPIEKDIR